MPGPGPAAERRAAASGGLAAPCLDEVSEEAVPVIGRLRVAVLMGGVSPEREVSLKSGKAVVEALRAAGHEAIPYDVVETNLDGLDDIHPDVAFVALHGAFGEDGGVQQLLEAAGLPYTGSGAEASRIGMDKVVSKRRFVQHAVPTADYFVVEPGGSARRVERAARELGYPLVCKPVDGGSSIGVSVVRGHRNLPDALDAALRVSRDGRAMLECYVRGRELTVGILDGNPLPMVEIVPRAGFFDYRAKYEDEATQYITPVSLIQCVYRKALAVSAAAFECLGCRHFGRVDLRYGYDGELCVLEVNTIPGLTSRSLLPLAAAQAGIGFVELCDSILRLAAAQPARLAARKKAG